MNLLGLHLHIAAPFWVVICGDASLPFHRTAAEIKKRFNDEKAQHFFCGKPLSYVL